MKTNRFILKPLLSLLLSALFLPGVSGQQPDTRDLDRLGIAVQKICPVSGSQLGSMGDPVKVRIGEQTAWLCCQACAGKQVDAHHWQAVRSNLAAAQQTCPIMEKPVTADMQTTVVQGQLVFVCCPPCIARIETDPDAALNQVRTRFASFIRSELLDRMDSLHMAAQQICPVSGQRLAGQARPVKVQVGEQVAFLCCQECVRGKISGPHWKTVRQNLARAQGNCPIMDHPVDAGKPSTVIEGRPVFVCCAPCLEKIEANPATVLVRLAEQYARAIDP